MRVVIPKFSLCTKWKKIGNLLCNCNSISISTILHVTVVMILQKETMNDYKQIHYSNYFQLFSILNAHSSDLTSGSPVPKILPPVDNL